MRLHTGKAGKASLVGAFFVLTFICPGVIAANCTAPNEATAVRVSYVYDGDSLTLADNRKIRLIGINTPEVAHDGQPPQPLSIVARNRVRQILFSHGNQVRVLFGEEKVDHYGRSLAHLWTNDGENLAANLLREGLGWALAIPPNTRFLDCYVEAENQARSASRGVWSHSQLDAKIASKLPLHSTGFHRVRGRVIRVNHAADATWVNLEGRFAIRIPDEDSRWFAAPPDQTWIGREVEVRGWLRQLKGELRVTVRHPAAITLLSPEQP